MPTTTADQGFPGLPFRIGIAVAATPLRPETEAEALAALSRLPEAAEALLSRPGEAARRTPLRWRVLGRPGSETAQRLTRALADAPDTVMEDATDQPDRLAERIDLVVRAEAGTNDDPLLAIAARRRLPVITLVPFGVEAAGGLNRAACDRLDQFNVPEAKHGEEGLRSEIWREWFDNPEGRRLSPEALEAVRRVLVPAWVRADQRARRLQTKYRRAGQTVWCLFPVAVAAAAVGALVPSLGVVAFPIQALLLLWMLMVVWRADRTRSLEGWVEHRLLAERLRVAAFMRAGGCEPGRFEPPPHLGQGGRGEWVAAAWEEVLHRLVPAISMPQAEPEAVRAFVARRWVAAQRDFHADRADRHDRLSRRLERAGHLVFLLALMLALVHSAAAMAGAHGTTWEHLLLFLGLVLPGAGAALGGFRAHREYSRIARRSGAMAAALTALEEQWDAPATGPELEARLRQVEQVFLGEVQDWIALMRAATVQPVG